MGDRIGIRFTDDLGNESVVVHSHWMGRDLLKCLQRFTWEMGDELKKDSCVESVCAKFLMWYGSKYGISDDLDVQDCEDDCEDNGIFVLNIDTGIIG